LYEDALIVITGDHNAFGTVDYARFANDRYGAPYAGQYGFVPMLILHTPHSGRHEEVVGQIDICPTLLALAGIHDAAFKGLGQNIFGRPGPRFAVNQNYQVVGDTNHVPVDEVQHRAGAWEISDLILKGNYFKDQGRQEPLQPTIKQVLKTNFNKSK
jgi:arylsulfatase A-like enzyme